MRVFISWSGATSGAVACALRDWLPMAVQSADVFVSQEDIASGEGWLNRLSSELKESEIGLVCLTPENLTSLWVHYEAGAVWKSLGTEANKVCPVLFNVAKRDVTGPLSQFQMRDLRSQAEVAQLLGTLFLESGQLTQANASEAIAGVWFPDLEQRLNGIVPPVEGAGISGGREDREVLDEILEMVRGLTRSSAAPSPSPKRILRRTGNVVSWSAAEDGSIASLTISLTGRYEGQAVTLSVPSALQSEAGELVNEFEFSDWDGLVEVRYSRRVDKSGMPVDRTLEQITRKPEPQTEDEVS